MDILSDNDRESAIQALKTLIDTLEKAELVSDCNYTFTERTHYIPIESYMKRQLTGWVDVDFKVSYLRKQMAIEPKPCPFCGEIPEVFPESPKTAKGAWGQVRCVNPHCLVRPSVEDGISTSGSLDLNACKEAAISRWNKRKR